MDNLYFIPNNILTKFIKKLTKYKNDYQQYLNYIYRNYIMYFFNALIFFSFLIQDKISILA